MHLTTDPIKMHACFISTQPMNKPCQQTLSSHPSNPPHECILSLTLPTLTLPPSFTPSIKQFIAATGNLRACNYKIPEADLHAARGIAGKITPAIATTTALVTGFICMEIYKLLQVKMHASSYQPTL